MEMFRSMLAPLHFVCFLSLWTHQSHLIKHILFPSIFAFRTESCRRLWWFQHCWRRIEQGAKIEGVQNKKSNWKYCLYKHPEPQIWWNFDHHLSTTPSQTTIPYAIFIGILNMVFRGTSMNNCEKGVRHLRVIYLAVVCPHFSLVRVLFNWK